MIEAFQNDSYKKEDFIEFKWVQDSTLQNWLMLFLLRKIRRKLMEKNRITTYLLYAIGEILLVVIGILIAVSINDASQQRKDQKVVVKYIATLIEELEANVTTLANDISYSQSRLDTLHTLKQSMAKPSATLDSLVRIARYHFDYGYDPDVYLNNITFNTLENILLVLPCWFASNNSQRLSYVNHLEKELTKKEIETVKSLFYGKLRNRVVSWETAIAYSGCYCTIAIFY